MSGDGGQHPVKSLSSAVHAYCCEVYGVQVLSSAVLWGIWSRHESTEAELNNVFETKIL
jgi:hypothetical protein